MTHPDHAREQLHLDETVDAMLNQIERWENRDQNVGADLETSLTLADDAEEHAAALSPHVHAPYFGSLTLHIAGKQQTVYIGRHAFMDTRGKHNVVSWESDVGGLFYDPATEWTARNGLKGTVRRKRQLDVQQKKLLNVTDLYDGGLETGAREDVLLRRLNEAATSGMRDVVNTLQPEQNLSVRATAGQTVVIQGAAGSGKTTVGFHRLAWLASPERGEHRCAPEPCMIMMPNEVLAAYSRKILPALQLEALRVTTPERWALSFLGLEKMVLTDRTLDLLLSSSDREERSVAWRRAKALGHNAVYHLIRAYLHHRLRQNARRTGKPLQLQAELNLGSRMVRIQMDDESITTLLDDVLNRDALEGYRRDFQQSLLRALVDTYGLYNHQEELIRVLSSDIQAITGRIFTGLMPVSETRRLLQDHTLLRSTATEHISDRHLDALTLPATRTSITIKAATIDVTELPAILTFHALLHGIGRPNGSAYVPFDHVVLDEGQDYAPLLYRMIARATRPGHVSVLGDLNQGLHGYKGPDHWESVIAAAASNPASRGARSQAPGQIMTLTRTYRSTREITDVCARIASSYNRSGQDVVGIDRSGTPVRRNLNTDLIAGVAEEVQALQALGHCNIALVCRKVRQAQALPDLLARYDISSAAITNELHRYEGGVVSIPVHLAKGLEFDACVAVGADGTTYDVNTEYETRLLYVTASRGMHALSLTAETALHPLLQQHPAEATTVQKPAKRAAKSAGRRSSETTSTDPTGSNPARPRAVSSTERVLH